MRTQVKVILFISIILLFLQITLLMCCIGYLHAAPIQYEHFRQVAVVPEPSVLMLLLLGSVCRLFL